MILVSFLEARPRAGAIKNKATQATDLMVFPAPGPAGSGRARTLPRWLLPVTDCRIAKVRTGPDLDERSFYFSMSPNQAIPADKSIRSSSLAAAQPLIILSWPRRSTPVAPGVPAEWPYGAMPVLCLLSLIYRNWPKQLGMVSPELAGRVPGLAWFLRLRRYRRLGSHTGER